jgi:hypothetical protein
MKTHCKYGHPLTEDNRVQFSASAPKGRCKICRDAYNEEWHKTHPEEVRTAQRKYRKRFREEHPESYLIEWLWYKYHMTLETYNALLLKQDERCAICRVLFDKESISTTPCVDHDHACCTGKRACGKCTRGLICGNCNRALGFLQDSPAVCKAAATYLETNLATKK